MTDPHRAQVLDYLATAVGIPDIARFIQHGRSNARLTMHMTDGRSIALGGPDTLFSQAEFGKAMLVHLGRMPKRLGTNDWRDVVGAIFAAAVDVDEDPDSTPAGRMREWLRGGYLQRAVPKDPETLDSREPFTDDDGDLHVFVDSLRRFIRLEHGDHVDSEELRQALRDLGAERVKHDYQRDGARTSASYYRVPRTALED